MKTTVLALAALAALPLPAQEIVPDKVEGPAYKVFQFPHDKAPRIDADLSDWDIVPDSYLVTIDDMWDDSGLHQGVDKSSIDIKVKVGWVKGLNRLYFCYEAYDDYWEFDESGLRNDTFEVVVDADLSGGPHIAEMRSDRSVREMESFFTFQNVHAQNYHIFTPAAFGKTWCMGWGPQQWLKYFPWSDIAYSYDFKPGEGGVLRMEFYITPFDAAYPAENAHEGDTGAPYGSVVSRLYEGKRIGLCWAVIDYDGEEHNNGFWNLSRYHKMYGNASMERLFELQPLEESILLPEASWSHLPVPGTRTVRFTDESTGKFDSWHWDFGDGRTSDERNPVHTYDKDGCHYTVTLTVDGPDGRHTCSKVWEVSVWGGAGTASSLFWTRDSLQTREIVSEEAVQYRNVGHHGPAVENAGFALRIYFNDSGAVDIYSKSGAQMELLKYLWYPTEAQQRDEGAGCDEYLVGKTVGVGGYSLWDGRQEVKLAATRGRTARAGKTPLGSYAEIISYGVICGKKSYDISVRADVFEGDRSAIITARELNGKKVRFMTGINHQPGADIRRGDGWAAVWGVHPSDVSMNPIPLGAGIIYDTETFPDAETTTDMVRLLSKPVSSVSTRVTAASTKEPVINTCDLFVSYVRDLAGAALPDRIPLDNGLGRYDFVYAGEWDTRKPDGQSLFVVRDGKVCLRYSIPMHDEWGRIQEFDDVKMMPDGSIVYAAMSQLGIIDRNGKLLWQYICPQGTESHTCQPLDKDRVYFSLNGNPARIVIYNWRKDEVEKEIVIPTSVTRTHSQLRHVRITPEGNFTVGLLGERKILELSPDGSVVNSISGVKAWHVEKLANGNYLMAGDNTRCVKELDKDGNTVWEVTQDDVPFKLHNVQTAIRLPDGNTIFNDWVAGTDASTWPGTVQFCEITADKKVVWTLSSWDEPDLGPSTAIEILRKHGK